MRSRMRNRTRMRHLRELQGTELKKRTFSNYQPLHLKKLVHLTRTLALSDLLLKNALLERMRNEGQEEVLEEQDEALEETTRY